MMKAAEFDDFDDHAMLHDLTLNRALFFQGEMRTRVAVLFASFLPNPPCSPRAGACAGWS